MTERAVYEQCGLRVRSVVELDLPRVDGEAFDVDVDWGDDLLDAASPPPGDVIAASVDGDADERWWYRATEADDGYRIRFHECGEFVITPDLTSVRIRRARSGRTELLPILMAGTVSAFLLALSGKTVLHASAVTVDGAALAFVGHSGRGKSTMAALMCLAGAALVTDDVLVVGAGPRVMCRGGAAGLRLRPAAAVLAADQPDAPTRATADERLSFTPQLAGRHAHPLGAIVIPTPSRTAYEVEVVRMSPGASLFAILAYPRVNGWRRSDVIGADFSTLGEVVSRVPVYQVAVPWGPPFSPSIAQTLARLVTAQGS